MLLLSLLILRARQQPAVKNLAETRFKIQLPHHGERRTESNC